MSCPQCEHMAEESRAASPGQLRQLITGVRAEIRNGVLEETGYPSDGVGGPQPPFMELPKAGPWPDAFAYGFRCSSCGQAFTLSAETYHGGGGRWRPQ